MTPEYLTQDQLSRLTFHRIFNILKKLRTEIRALYFSGDDEALLSKKQNYLTIVKTVIKNYHHFERNVVKPQVLISPWILPIYTPEKLALLSPKKLREHVQDVKKYTTSRKISNRNKRNKQAELELLSNYLIALRHVKRK